jgi:hypothetical protein
VLGLLIGLALVAALAFTGARWLRRARLRRRLESLPGGSTATAIEVSSFDDIDAELRKRRCHHCGSRYDAWGEGSTSSGARRLRTVNLECRLCERRMRVHFDVSRLFH